MKFSFEHLSGLLRMPADQLEVVELIERPPEHIKIFTYQCYVEFKAHGISVMFKQAPCVIPSSEVTNPEALYLDAFHLHRQDHEGYSQYRGALPGGVAFGDSLEQIVRKLGEPVTTGGGGASIILKKPVPYWVRYSLGPNECIQFQFDDDGNMEMATL